MKKYTIEELQLQRESEDHVEFKKAENGNFSYNGASKMDPKDRRKCILGYVVALCNENGGRLVLGMHDAYPHAVVGTSQSLNAIGVLESEIYKDLGIRPMIYELYDENKKRVLVIEVPPRPTGKLFKFEDVPFDTAVTETLALRMKAFYNELARIGINKLLTLEEQL